MNAEWQDILAKVRSGEMSVEEAAARLGPGAPSLYRESVEAAPGMEPGPTPVPQESTYVPEPEDIQPDLGWWKDAWLILFWAGTGVIVLSALFMGWAYGGSRNFWMFCSWLPMLLGIFALLLGMWSRQARWLHVRVHDSNGKRVAVSMPLPLTLTSWFFRVFGSSIPSLREQHMDDLYLALDALKEAEGPVTIEVNDEDGDRVRVYIL